MSNDLPEFMLFYYYDASVEELEELINNHSFNEIKYHVKMLENIEAFNHFFKRYRYIDPSRINNIKKLQYLNAYYEYLWNNGKFSYNRY